MQLTKDQKKIKDLLYIQKIINEIICVEAEEIMRGRGNSVSRIRERIEYNLNERFEFMLKDEKEENNELGN